MRLIDADALFPGKLLVVNLKNPMETAKDLLNRINTAPTIDAVPVVRWIPVTERLPEPNTTVIASTDNGIVFQCLYAYDGWDLWEGNKVNVTHWMPMPEPPKEGE